MGCILRSQYVEIPKLWDYWHEKLNVGSGSRQQQRCMKSFSEKEPATPFETEASSVWHRAAGFGVCLAGFRLDLVQIWLISVKWKFVFCAIVCWEYILCVFILQNNTVKRLPWVSEETLDIETVLGLFYNMEIFEIRINAFALWVDCGTIMTCVKMWVEWKKNLPEMIMYLSICFWFVAFTGVLMEPFGGGAFLEEVGTWERTLNVYTFNILVCVFETDQSLPFSYSHVITTIRDTIPK